MRTLLLVAALALSASALQIDEQELYNSAPAGCSAALKCTPLEYCTAAGVMSDVVVNISAEKRLFSAPLTNCRLDGGRVGKCCRDPNYTDPWPVDMIGKWVPGIFEKNNSLILDVVRTTPKAIAQKVQFGLGVAEKKEVLQQGLGQVAQVAEGGEKVEYEVGVGQYVIPGEEITVEEGGIGQYEEGGFGEIGVGGYGVGFKQSIYRLLLRPYYTNGAKCGRLRSRPPFGNHVEGEADFAQYPWQAMVLEQDGEEKSLRCGGIITRPDVVLTSAACVDGLAPEKILVKGGEWKLGVDEEPLPFQIAPVKNILYHPYYQSGTYQYDVVILVLAENLRFSENIYPICMPSAEDSEALYGGAGLGAAFGLGYGAAYGQCVVTGWGKEVLQAHRLGAVMHDLNVTVIKPDECKARINKYYPSFEQYFNTESSVCAEPSNPLQNICSVDIGSALACPNKEGHYVLSAIYSWDTGCKQLGNQLGAFYKFDLEWYLWAIGAIESERLYSFNVGAILAGAAGQIKAQSEGFGIKQEGLQLAQGGGGFFVGQAQVESFTTKPEIFTYTTKPEIFTYTTKPQIVTYTTKPKIVTYTTKPKIVTYTTKPQIVTYTTQPKIVTYTTKPEIITYTTQPKVVTYTTKPEILTYTTKPEIITYTTKPQILTYGVEAQQVSGLPVELSEGLAKK